MNKKIKLLRNILLSAIVFLSFSCSNNNNNEQATGAEVAVLTDAPNVPPPIARSNSTRVVVNLETREVISRLADGVEYEKWTFGGKSPGRFVRVREGDIVEVNLHNHPSSKMMHNIDMHACTGPGGGAASSNTAPGHTSKFSFKALNPGLYMYHCATPPVPLHVANGMYGLILVEPKEGLPKVDKEFYIMQSEFYTEGNFGDPGLQAFSLPKALDERPPYVVFNGEVGSMTGDKALKVNVGETVRFFVGNAGPNLISSLHLIGEIYDKVYMQGGTKVIQNNVGTTLIPAGGTAIIEVKFDVPGEYLIVDHSLFRAFNKGAVGTIIVQGEADKNIYSGKISDEIYLGQGTPEENNLRQPNAVTGGSQTVSGYTDKQLSANQPATTQPIATPSGNSAEEGRQIFTRICQACHQPQGQGMPGVFPPLAKSDFLMADKQRSIKIVSNGFSGPITVNGKNYNGVMPNNNLTDQQVAAVLTYVRSNFGNNGDKVTVDEVRKVRGK